MREIEKNHKFLKGWGPILEISMRLVTLGVQNRPYRSSMGGKEKR